MRDLGSGLSRLCPACGRRVPRTVATCRCGAELPELADEPVADAPGRTGLTAGNLLVFAGLLTAVGALGYWSLTRPPASAVVSQAEALGIADGGTLRPPLEAKSIEISAERRAWDASAAQADTAQPAAVVAPATTLPPASLPSSLEDVVSRAMPAVVLVETSTGRGSGFFVRPDTLITNVHVVQNDTVVKLRRVDGTTVQARVESRSPAFDIAVLKVMVTLPGQAVIPMGTADSLRAGQEVVMIGSALGTLQNSVTRGIVSGVRQSGNATLVQTDAAANPGNSGGPLLDRSGTAIGITTLGYRDSQGLNFAVAIDHARAILDGRSPGTATKPTAMNELKDLTPAMGSGSRTVPAGETNLTTTLGRLSKVAALLDAEWRRFRQSCFTSAVPGSYSHEWFVMLTARPVAANQIPGGSCVTFLSAFQEQATKFRTQMREALEAARRAGVVPGVVRDALAASRLEFDGWDR